MRHSFQGTHSIILTRFRHTWAFCKPKIRPRSWDMSAHVNKNNLGWFWADRDWPWQTVTDRDESLNQFIFLPLIGKIPWQTVTDRDRPWQPMIGGTFGYVWRWGFESHKMYEQNWLPCWRNCHFWVSTAKLVHEPYLNNSHLVDHIPAFAKQRQSKLSSLDSLRSHVRAWEGDGRG